MYDLMKIKKYYGENMMYLCRELFPTLLEQKGLLFSILESKFVHSRFLYDDIVNTNSIEKFKDYIYSVGNRNQKRVTTQKTPTELLEEAGYTLYECHNEDDIQRFIVYYDYDEELCTFNGGRLEDCHVFFAVKKNVDDINRWDFPNPQREDEYGTSVISIQFTRGENNTLSIKNRYNHTVENPDATFSNNLENIIPGLTTSFEQTYNLKINQDEGIEFELPGYVKATNGKYYKYNYEINNVYYCLNNIIISNFDLDEEFIEKEKFLVIDYFVIDLMQKKIYPYDEKLKDCFCNDLKNIKNISIVKTPEGKLIEITLEEDKKAYIEVDNRNRIISYKNEHIKTIGHNFLSENKTLKKIELPNAEIIGQDFLFKNLELTSIVLPNVEEIESYFISKNQKITTVELPKVKKIHSSFLTNNNKIIELNLPNLEETHNSFLHFNEILEVLNVPKLKIIGISFLPNNKNLKRLDLPNVEIIYDNVLSSNQVLEYLNAPKLKKVGFGFMYEHPQINITESEKIEFAFLYDVHQINSQAYLELFKDKEIKPSKKL